MSKIIQPGPYALVAKKDADLTTLDLFTVDNCSIIYQTEGQYKSWKPGRLLNGFSTLEKDKGYIVIAKQTVDVSEYFDPESGTLEAFYQISNFSNINFNLQWQDSGGTQVGDLITIFNNSAHKINKSDIPVGAVNIRLLFSNSPGYTAELALPDTLPNYALQNILVGTNSEDSQLFNLSSVINDGNPVFLSLMPQEITDWGVKLCSSSPGVTWNYAVKDSSDIVLESGTFTSSSFKSFSGFDPAAVTLDVSPVGDIASSFNVFVSYINAITHALSPSVPGEASNLLSFPISGFGTTDFTGIYFIFDYVKKPDDQLAYLFVSHDLDNPSLSLFITYYDADDNILGSVSPDINTESIKIAFRDIPTNTVNIKLGGNAFTDLTVLGTLDVLPINGVGVLLKFEHLDLSTVSQTLFTYADLIAGKGAYITIHNNL
jgi:hypothetical protein